MSRRLRNVLWASAVFLGACLPTIWIFQVAVPLPSVLMGPTSTDPYFNLYVLEWGARHWERGFSGFWSAPFFYPTSWATALSDHLLLPSALYRGLQALGAAPALCYNVLLLLSFSATAVSVYLLLRRASRATDFVCACASMLVVFAPWRLGQLTHLQMLWAPGPPLLFLAVDAFFRKPCTRRAFSALAALGLTLLSGCYLAYFSVLISCVIGALYVVRRRGRARLLRRMGPTVAFLLAGIALLVTVFAPYWFARQELGTQRTPKDFGMYGAQGKDWLAPSSLNAYSSIFPPDWIRPERDLFPGWTLTCGLTLFLLLWTSRRASKKAPALASCLIWGGAAFSVLEFPFAYEALSHVLPGLDGMRVPTRVHFFVLLGMSVAGARAVGPFLSTPKHRWQRFAVAVLFLASSAADLSLRALPPEAYFSPERPDHMPRYVSLLRDSDVGALAVFPLQGTHEDIPRMWRGLVHGKPIANGYSGYLSDSFRYLKWSCKFPNRRIGDRCVTAMKDLKLTHFVVESASSAVMDLDARVASIVKPETHGVKLIYYDAEIVAFSLLDD